MRQETEHEVTGIGPSPTMTWRGRAPSDSAEIREGVRLAVQLSDLLARLASKIPGGLRVG